MHPAPDRCWGMTRIGARLAVLAAAPTLALAVTASPALAGTGMSVNDTVTLEGSTATVSGTYSCRAEDNHGPGETTTVRLQVLLTQGTVSAPDYVPGTRSIQVSCPATNRTWQMAINPNTGGKWRKGPGNVEAELFNSSKLGIPGYPPINQPLAELNRAVSID